MSKTKIFGIGITGLVGSRIVELLPQYSFDNLSLETGVNITDPSTLDVIRNDTDHDWVLHLAAKADVDSCEADKAQGEEGAAYKINILGTKNVVEAAKASKKKIIYISTDFVFDGKVTPENGYTEEDVPNPTSWYAHTKLEGEKIVQESGLHYVIARIAYPFREDAFALKKDFYHAIKDRLADGQHVAGITDHTMTPTHIDDIAHALGKVIETNAEGIFHIVGSQSMSPYEVTLAIAERFGYDKKLISKTTREEYFNGKAPRPFNLTLNNDKIEQLGVKMQGFSEALKGFH
jgi:dTDP-4-dehydrorhamnose reductase